MEEKRKCIEIYITRTEGKTEETVEFKNIVEDTPENAEWFRASSDIMKQIAYVLYKIHENDIEEGEVTYSDREGETGEREITVNCEGDKE